METWSVEEDDGGEVIALPTDSGGFAPLVRGPWTTGAQMRLASAAPEMARVLLEIEWSARDGTMCPSCNGDIAPAYAAAEFGHADACELDAAIRKAGLR